MGERTNGKLPVEPRQALHKYTVHVEASLVAIPPGISPGHRQGGSNRRQRVNGAINQRPTDGIIDGNI